MSSDKISKGAVRILMDKLNSRINAEFRKAQNRKHKRVRKSSDECLADFVHHLEWLKSRHCKSQYQDAYLVSWIFRKPESFNTETEIAGYCRAHLYVALEQLKILVIEMRSNANVVTAAKLYKYEPYLSDYLFDLRLIVQTLERKKDPTYIFFNGSKAYSPMSWQIFQTSKQLAALSTDANINLDHRQAQITAVFVLRQALELKFQRIVAVIAYNASGNTAKLKHDFYYSFIKQNLSLFQFSSVDFLLIEKIYQWCNSIVHNAVQPFPWQVSYALQICSGLYATGPATPGGGGYSIHGGVSILGKDTMQEAFAKHFCSFYSTGIWCLEYFEPEAIW